MTKQKLTHFNLEEILKRNIAYEMESPENLASAVSNRFGNTYPKINQAIYKLKREIIFFVRSKEQWEEWGINFFTRKILGSFSEHEDVQRFQKYSTISRDTVPVDHPLILIAKYPCENAITSKISGHPHIEFDAGQIQVLKIEYCSDALQRNGRSYKADFTFHKEHVFTDLKGVLIDKKEEFDLTIDIPQVPTDIIKQIDEAAINYYTQLKEIKQKGFKTQAVPPHELYIIWIPAAPSMSVECKEIDTVEPIAAVILRIAGQYDHLIGTWKQDAD